MITAFKKYLTTLKLGSVSRKLYSGDVRKFLSWLPDSTLSHLTSPSSYSTYLAHLRSQATAPSMIKRTLASLKQFGNFIAATYSVPNPASPAVASAKAGPTNYLTHFTNYLNQDHLSPLTIKSYKSDITRYLDWSNTHNPGTEIAKVLTDKNINKYLNHLRQSLSSLPATIERKSQSLARFSTWYSKTYSPTLTADSDSHSRSEGLPHSGSVSFPNFRSLLTLAILLLFVSTLAIFGYRQFSRDATLTAAYPSTPVTPNRQLSFQGRLENAGGTPITTATDMVFKLFTASSGGTELYSTGTCSIDPDTDGVFNTQIGSTCGAAIAATVFTENSAVWLEVTIVAETLTPRQQIATVAYALNSETLQGFPISSTVSAIRNTVVPMNQWGEILVGEQSPRLTGVSGTFQISAPALSIITATGTNGNISLAPDGTGQINATGNTTSTNFFNISNAQLTTGSLITGTAGTDVTGFKLLDLLSGASPTSKFSVTDAGNVTLAGDLTVSGTNATLPNDSISPNEIFTTSQTDEYCLTYETTGGTWEWQTCGGGPGSGSNWRIASGALSPLNDTLDLLVGNIATASAKFSVNATSGNVALAGDLTITGDDLFMATNTANYFLMADGTNYNPTSPADARTGLGIAAGGAGDIWVEKAGDTMTGALTNTLATGNSLVWDTNTLIVDATNDKVGIGNAAPVGKLDVSGAVTGKAMVILNETGDQNILTASASGVTRMNLTTEGYVEAQRFADLANTTYYLDPAAAGVSLAMASGSLTSGVADGATAVAFTLNSTNTLSTQGSKLLSLQNNGTEKMYLDASGNLYVSGTIVSGNGTSMLLTNKSGGIVASKAIVVLDTSNNTSFTTTTTPYNKAGFGVVVGVGLGVANDADGDGVCDANDICMVAYGGSVNVTVKNATTAVKGDYLFTSDTAGSAVASAKQYDGLVGIVDDTTNAASGYLKMIFKVQPQVTAAAAIDKTTKHNEYWLYADQYQAVGEGANTDTNLLQRGLAFDTFTDTTKTDSANTTASLDTNTQKTGLIGGQTLATSTTDNAGNTYLGSNTVNDTFLYERTRDSSPQVQVELGIDPNWYNGVTLSVATTSAQFSQNSVITKPNPNLSTSYNGSLVKVTGTYASNAKTIYITIKSPTTFDWTDYNGQAATAVTMTPGTAQALGTTGVSATFTNARYNTGDVFKIASWFVEPASSTRGGTAKFPERSTIIATASSVDIIDADTQKLWMRFSQGTSYAIGVDANNDPSSANMLNGKAYISTNGSAATGLYTLDFAHDAAFKQNATDWRLSDTALSGRNGTNTYNVMNTSNILVNITANDVSAAVIPNQPTQEVTVSGWGYIVGNGTYSIYETVNLPYKFNNNPIVNISAAGNTGSSTVPTKLSDCTGNTYSPLGEARGITTTSFVAAIFDPYPTNIAATTYVCYTWTATGQVSPRQYVAVATGNASGGGISVINETDQTVASINGTGTDRISNKIFLSQDGALYADWKHPTTGHHDSLEVWYHVPAFIQSLGAEPAANFTYNYGSVPSIHADWNTSPYNTINSIYVTSGTSTIDGKSNTIYVGTSAGLDVVQEKRSDGTCTVANCDGSSDTSGSVKYYTKDYISEEMVGNISTMLPFSSNGSLSMTDVSVGAITYTNTGSVTAVTGVRGVGADFGSANSSKYITAGAKVINVGQKSVGFWLKTSQTSSGMILDSNGVDSSQNGFYSIINSTANKVQFRQNKASAGLSDYNITSNASINDGNWHFIVNTWSGDTQSDGVKIYIDGNLDNQNTATSFVNNTATNNLRIGAVSGASPGYYYSGNLDEVFATGAVLTAGQIKNMYQVGYRALQSHATTLGGGAADTNQQLGGTTNVIGAAQPDYNNQFMYVGTNSTTLGAVSKIDLNSDTNIKTYNSSANVPTGGPLLIDEDTKSLAVGYNLEAVGSATTGVKTMGVDNNATATSGNFIGKTVTTAESFNQAYLWAQYTLDASDASNTIEVWASNDGGSNYYQCNLTNTDTSRSPSEYEYFCQFNTAGSSLKTKFVMARGSTKTNTYVSKYGISWIDSNAVAGSANGSGLFTGSNASVANGSYIDVAHNQNSNDLVNSGWVYNTTTSKWELIDNNTNNPTAATGGTITNSGGYTIHTFTGDGTFTPNGAGNVEVLAVAGGGGGGGGNAGGGGGAGDYLYNAAFTITSQAYTVTVGTGGAGGAMGANGNQGSNSIFSTLTATGGGYGGAGWASNAAGGTGGSGGGGGAKDNPGAGSAGGGVGGVGTHFVGGAGTSNGTIENVAGGGGGGAGGAGVDGGNNAGGTGGDGGNGVSNSITGSAVYYAGGGGGGVWSAGSVSTAGGLGGGGNGSNAGQTQTARTTNTGGGGAGGGTAGGNAPGQGGDKGIVIVRYLTNSLSAFKITQQDANTARLYNYSGATQNLRLDVITGGLGRNAGTVSLAPAAADVDSQASTNSIWINKTGSAGNLLKLQTSGTDVLSLTGAGALTLTGSATISGTLSLAPYTQGAAGTCNASAAGKMYYDGTANVYYFCNGSSWTQIGSGSGASYWDQTLGTLQPFNTTVDLLIGGTATSSAKFAVLNINSGTPTASVSAGIAGGGYLTATGTLATTAMQTLTLGNTTTGNIVLAPGGTTALTAIGANLTASGTLTLPNSNTLTGVSNYLRLSQGLSVGGADTYYFSSAGAINAGAVTATSLTDSSLSPGSIIFAGTAGLLSEDNSNFYWDNAGKRLGLGTSGTGMLATLDVRSTLGTIPVASISGDTAMAALVVDQSGIGDLFTASKSGDTKFVITNAGNVGIGVSNPTNKLEIGGATSAISNTSGDITIDSASSNISFAGDSLINILNTYVSGELGVGIADAVSKLHVYGAVTGKALAIFDEIGDQDIFTASASGITKFRLTNAGNLSLAGSSYINFDLTDGTSGYGIRDNAGTLEYKNLSGSWAGIGTGGGGGSSAWRYNLGTLSPLNDTVDLLVGGNATSSAKFAVLNIDSGTPTASVSAGVAGGAYLTATGILATTAKQTLALGDSTTTGNIILQGGNVGIGVASPTQKLEVNGYVVGQRFEDSASASYYLDPAATGTSLSIDGNIVGNGAFYLSTGADATAVSIGTTGAGKLDAGTIDPPYTINGDKFATYMTSMTGVKEETTGVVAAQEYVPGIGYRATLDFASSSTGSDLWLFSKVSNLQNNLDKMVVLLSASGNTKTWYEVDAGAGLLYLYAQTPTTISYRLTAPRFDANSWGNARGDDSESLGFVLTDPSTWSVPESIASLFSAPSSDLLSPLAPDQPIMITAPVVITPPLGSSGVALMVEGEIEATTISARLAKLDEIQADTITARNIVADTISANHIEGLDLKIESSITERIKARLALLTGNEPTAEDVPVPEGVSSTGDLADGQVGTAELGGDSLTGTASATLASADIDFATINNYLAVIGQAVMTDLDVTGHLYATGINSKTGLLALGDNTLLIDDSGQVMVNGDLTVSGTITASELNLERLNVYDEAGSIVASIDASGSANLASLTTNMITIASSSEASNSATPSGLLTSMTTSNATAGESVLISPNTELTINSPYITPNSLVYLTPTTNTDNKVVFVKSKNSCDPNLTPNDYNLQPPCTPSFTVGIDLPASSDISFNWWIIQLGAPAP